MKVTMKRFPRTYKTSRLFERYIAYKHKKYYWQVSENDYTGFQKWLEKISDKIDDFLNWAINHRRPGRKVNVVVHDFDTWNGDQTLAAIIWPFLEKYKEVSKEIIVIDEETLDAMIFSFKEIALFKPTEAQYFTGIYDGKFETQEDGTLKMVYGPNHTREVLRDELDAYHKKLQDGIDKFAAGFQGLWN